MIVALSGRNRNLVANLSQREIRKRKIDGLVFHRVDGYKNDDAAVVNVSCECLGGLLFA